MKYLERLGPIIIIRVANCHHYSIRNDTFPMYKQTEIQ